MTNGVPDDESGGTGSSRHVTARKARELRSAQKRRDRRNRWMLQAGIGVAIVAVLAVVAVVLATSIRPPQNGPANMASDGILISKGLKAVRTAALRPDGTPTPNAPNTNGQVVDIVVYLDYLCPQCGQFERTNVGQLATLVNSGAATLEIHPLPMLISKSQGTKYSLRSTNAAACVANFDPDGFFAFSRELFNEQPAEGTPGLTDAQLKEAVATVKASPQSRIDSCIGDGSFESWAQDALSRALQGPIPNSKVAKLDGTPLILVDGQQYTGSLTSSDDFRAFIVQAQSQSYASSTPTPSPSVSSTGSSVSSTTTPTKTP